MVSMGGALIVILTVKTAMGWHVDEEVEELPHLHVIAGGRP